MSELEGCVLGFLWKHGASTAYAVRKEMIDSPSSHWSGSAGAIYPLLERLEKRGVVASSKGARGDREHWTYELTDRGRDAFMAWLAPPLAYDIVSLAPDPLRTRMFFLGALSPKRRVSFISEAREKLVAYIDELKDSTQEDEFDRLATRGAIRATRARIAWLDDVRRAFEKKQKPRPRKPA